jgi:hypothetical protein
LYLCAPTLSLLQKKPPKHWNTITLNPLNPNASLSSNDTMQRQFFPKDETLHDIVKSDEFKKLLRTDTTTEEGQDYIAQYYDAETDWEALKNWGEKKRL